MGGREEEGIKVSGETWRQSQRNGKAISDVLSYVSTAAQYDENK